MCIILIDERVFNLFLKRYALLLKVNGDQPLDLQINYKPRVALFKTMLSDIQKPIGGYKKRIQRNSKRKTMYKVFVALLKINFIP